MELLQLEVVAGLWFTKTSSTISLQPYGMPLIMTLTVTMTNETVFQQGKTFETLSIPLKPIGDC